MSRERTFWQAFGPGILFCGAAVGVSHLVQATRAGAVYGLGLVAIVVVANVAKYPAFRFGPHYAAATGTSLLDGYRRQGIWALVLYGVLTLGTMFTVQAAVTIVTAGLAVALFGLTYTPVTVAVVLTLVCAGIIAVGRYRWLDAISKVVVAVLTVATVLATVLALAKLDWSTVSVLPPREAFDPAAMIMVAGLIGWMPSAIDISVWQSLWTLARRDQTGHVPSMRESMLDFHIGYWGTAALALCFLVLGAAVMHGRGAAFESSAGAFAAQVIALYTDTLGGWARPVIGVAALSVMFSTTLTVVDGFPRALSVLVARFRGAEQPGAADGGADQEREDQRLVYWTALAIMAVGSIVILHQFLADMKRLVDVATVLSFLTAPALAWLNHRAVTSAAVPVEHRPARWLVVSSWLGIGFLGGFSAYFLYLRLVVLAG